MHIILCLIKEGNGFINHICFDIIWFHSAMCEDWYGREVKWRRQARENCIRTQPGTTKRQQTKKVTHIQGTKDL